MDLEVGIWWSVELFASDALSRRENDYSYLRWGTVMFRVGGKVWRERVFVVATVITIVLIASHPELRLLVPLIDVMGIDIFLAVLGFQFWAALRQFALEAYKLALLPLVSFSYRALIFLFGYMGSYVNARVVTHRFVQCVEA